MYPSKSNPTFGIFVHNIRSQLENQGGIVAPLAVIKGTRKGLFQKIIRYSQYFFSVIIKGLFGSYNVIYLHYLPHSIIPTLFFNTFRNKPLIVHAQGGDLEQQSAGKTYFKFLRILSKIALNKAEAVLVPSKQFREMANKTYGIDKAKIYISPSGGVNRGIFKPLNAKDSKNELVISNNLFVIGFVSRFVKGKGTDVFLKSLRLLNIDNFAAVMVGFGPLEKNIVQTIRNYGLTDKITVYDNHATNHASLVNYFNAFDVFIFPTTLKESLGLVGLEAMACSIPVIASDIDVMKEYMEDGRNGFLFKPGDEVDLSNKIEIFYKLNPEQKKAMKTEALLTAKEFDADSHAEKLMKIFQHTLHC